MTSHQVLQLRSANQWGLLVAIAYVEWRESVIAAKLIMVSVSNGNRLLKYTQNRRDTVA